MEIWDEVIKEFNLEINNLRISLGNGSAEDYPDRLLAHHGCMEPPQLFQECTQSPSDTMEVPSG